jgi:hypothetical protein
VVLAAEYDTSNQAGTASVDFIVVTIFYTITRDYQWNIGVDQDDNTVAGGSGGGASFFSMN